MFNSGGNYTNTTNAGVFYSNGNNNTRTNTNTNIGFRSALPRPKGRCQAATAVWSSRLQENPQPIPRGKGSAFRAFGNQKAKNLNSSGPLAGAKNHSVAAQVRNLKQRCRAAAKNT